MARRIRSRQPDESSADAPRVKSPDALLEDVSHELKLLDIKRRSILETTARLPWLYIAAVFVGAFLVLSIFAISPLFMFVFGSLFAGVMANITGPIGALTLRRKAYQEVMDVRERLFPMMAKLPAEISPVLFGVADIRKTGLQLSGSTLKFRELKEPMMDTKGGITIGFYKYIGMAFRGLDGQIDLGHPALRRQDWLVRARLKGISDAQIIEALGSIA